MIELAVPIGLLAGLAACVTVGRVVCQVIERMEVK